MSLPPLPGPDDDDDAADDSIVLLDEVGGWALWLPDDTGEAVVVHGHGPDGGDEDGEWLFVECDAVTDSDGAPAVRCPECGMTVPETQIDAWIAAAPDLEAE